MNDTQSDSQRTGSDVESNISRKSLPPPTAFRQGQIAVFTAVVASACLYLYGQDGVAILAWLAVLNAGLTFLYALGAANTYKNRTGA